MRKYDGQIHCELGSKRLDRLRLFLSKRKTEDIEHNIKDHLTQTQFLKDAVDRHLP